MANKKFSVSEYPTCEADDELSCLIRARYNLIYVVTWEEQRVLDSLVRISDQEKIGGVQAWDAAHGMTNPAGSPVPEADNLVTLEDVVDHIMAKADEARGAVEKGPVFLLRDVFRYLDQSAGSGVDPSLERKLRSLSSMLKSTSIYVVMTSPVMKLPTSLEKCVTVLDYPLPGRPQLGVLVSNAKAQIVSAGITTAKVLDDPSQEKVIDSVVGLTFQEAEDALAKSIVKAGKFDVEILNEIKREIIRKGELLEFVSEKEGMDSVGGFHGLKDFVRMRKAAFTEEARAYGLPTPRGIFMLGIQGSGKSLCATAVASELRVPLLRMDMGSIFGSYVGESESRIRAALSMAESVAPCVLLVDEVDKSLSGSTGGRGDGGTTHRVVGHLLGWMQSRKAPVFVVACANSLRTLPPEMLRKGRFDELFFVDLPNEEERKEIFGIHLMKRNRDPSNFDVNSLASSTGSFSGAEIEAVIVEGMHLAFDDDKREVTTKDVSLAISNCKPLAMVDLVKESIDELREESRGRMRRVGDPLYALPKGRPGDGSRFSNIKKEKKNDHENERLSGQADDTGNEGPG